ncbi:class I SAM-dependent methyltransferase [Flavobacteriales bacterium]|nr:class I SAM-dependent methyltransferase [Flavobacteriales bacterium]
MKKIINSYKRNGLITTIIKIITYPLILFNRRKFLIMSSEERFNWIYKNNYWKSNESLSGPGSTLKATENIRKELPKVLLTHKISTVLDAPCGDFNWMKYLLPNIDINYIGGDIVKEMVDLLNSKYTSEKVKFIKLDLRNNSLPHVDLLISRDFLFHLPYKDIYNVLENFINSKIPYLLTTTHKNKDNFKNRNLQSGEVFRKIDLFSHPFNFPTSPLARFDDWVAPAAEREMCLFSREQILSVINSSSLRS